MDSSLVEQKSGRLQTAQTGRTSSNSETSKQQPASDGSNQPKDKEKTMANTLQPAKFSPTKARQRTPRDPLEEAGFVSKGDTTLLDPKAQEVYYDRIVERYMKFCSDYSNDLDAAFASLPSHRSEDSTTNPPTAPASAATVSPSPRTSDASPSKKGKPVQPQPRKNIKDSAARDLSVLLLSLRKLREGVIATASKTPIEFAQQVHMFCIRTGILAHHPPSYYAPLKRLLNVLNTPSNPLSESDQHEFTTYLILDSVCRQNDLHTGFDLRGKAKVEFAFHNRTVNDVLSALVHDNWVLFWKSRKGAEGYTRSLMDWAVGFVRRRSLKCISKTYLTVDLGYIIKCCTGKNDGCTWEQLVELEGLGWRLEGNKVIIRTRKLTAKPK